MLRWNVVEVVLFASNYVEGMLLVHAERVDHLTQN